MPHRRTRLAALACAALALAPSPRAAAQPWREDAAHVATTARVLLVGARPEDGDNALLAWLRRGRGVETAYLSLTRGESGANLLGDERQAPLAVVRTAELLAERERDGARQYFTRAYDFGSTPLDSVVDAAWPRDSLLHDVVAVVRAFRPHVVVALASEDGEPDAARRRAARLAAEAFAAAADTTRVPSSATSRLPAWTVSRLLTVVDGSAAGDARAGAPAHVVAVDVGEFDRASGRSYAELGAEIRRLQRTQGAPPASPLGPTSRRLRVDSARIADRDGEPVSLFGALDTTLARFHPAALADPLPPDARAHLDTLEAELAAVRAAAPSGDADTLAARLARVAARTSEVRLAMPCRDVSGVPGCPGAPGDLAVALDGIRDRATDAMLGAAGLVVDGVVARPLVAAGDSVPLVATVYNGGRVPVHVRRVAAFAGTTLATLVRDTSVVVPPGGARRWSGNAYVVAPTYHWWQIHGLVRGTWIHDRRPSGRIPVVPQLIRGEGRPATSGLEATISLGGVDVPVIVGPLAHRDDATPRGDVRAPLAGVPETSVLLEHTSEYARAGQPIDRVFRVHVRSDRSSPDTLAVTLHLPDGVAADSTMRTVGLPAFGSQDLFFRLRGALRAGTHTIAATARSVATPAGGAGQRIVRRLPAGDVQLGAVTREYPHIPAQQFVRAAEDRVEAVDVRIPATLRVAYVRGAEDLREPLSQLGVAHQDVHPALLGVVDLSPFTTVLIGPNGLTRDTWGAAVPALHAFLRAGGTVVALSGRDDLASSGLLPHPVAFDGAPSLVDDPAAAVEVSASGSRLLRSPNVVAAADFEGWTGDRARHVPAAADPRYEAPLVVREPGRAAVGTTLLAARVGAGTIVHTSLAIGDQLAGTVPGAARLLVNLLAAGLDRTQGDGAGR